jgi:hypothetical protein
LNKERMIEKEVILLRNIYDHIGEMVNFSLFEIQRFNGDSIILFKDMNQRKLFFILLVDFLSITDDRGPIGKTSFLRGIVEICKNPSFSTRGSEQELLFVTENFINWLNEKREIDIWMPSLDAQVDLSISRLDALKMSGDMAKHNYLRASGVALRLKEILKEAGIEVGLDQALLAFPDFCGRFQDDILIYLSSHICEFLNNIRWGIHRYLRPEFLRSYRKRNDSYYEYSFTIPDQIVSEYARDCYWALMNYLRSDPYMEKFIIAQDLKTEY